MAKLHWRPFPCPDYDLEGAESWLQSMAARGLFLRKVRLGLAGFATDEPKSMRYRLNATRGTVLDDAWSAPDGEERELSAAAGWQYVCPRGRFFIYACDDPQAPELHTDPAVQALQLKHIRSDAWASFASEIYFAIIHPLLWFRGEFWRMFAALPQYLLGFAVVAVLGLGLTLYRAFYLWGLTRRLRRGQVPVRDARQRRRGMWLQGAQTAELAVLLLFIMALFARWGVPAAQPLPDYADPLPFATLEDLAGGGTVDWDEENNYIHNRVTVSHTLTAPAVYDFEQHAVIRQGGRAVLAGGLYVDYYETRWPWLAERVGRELRADWLDAKSAEPLTVPGVDEAWWTPGPYSQLLLRRGCRVMSVTYYTASDRDPTLEQVLPAFAERFLA